MSCIRTLALLTLLTSCGPLDSWNPPQAQIWDPCPQVYPYFRGYEKDGSPNCTTRPFDMDNWAVDQLNLP